MSLESVMPSNHLAFCCPLLLPSIFPSISVFSNKSALPIRWPKYWSFSMSPSNEYSGLISFRIHWYDLLAVQGTRKSLLHTTVQKHQFFSTQPSLWSNSHIHTWLLEIPSVQFSSFQSLSRVWLFATPWIAACQASLSITNSRRSLRLTSIESVMPSSHLILCCPLLLLPPLPSSIRVFSNESTLHMRWPKYWSFSVIPSKEIPGLISFRMDWLDLLAVQGTLRSLLQHRSSKASILQRSAFTVQLSHPYMTTGKTTALTRWTFVGKVMSLLLNMLTRLVITFLPRSKLLLISWLQSPSAVILEPPKIKSDAVSTVSPSISLEVME